MMTTEWQQIDTVRMNLKTAELRQSLRMPKPHLFLAADLVTIARGSCQLNVWQDDGSHTVRRTIRRADHPHGSAGDDSQSQLPRDDFDQFYQLLRHDGPRTVTMSMLLAEKLAVSVDGVLWIEQAMTIPIRDINIQVPLR